MRTYLIIMTVLAVITFVLSGKDVLGLLIVGTLGLGLPLLLIPQLFYYGLALFPLFLPQGPNGLSNPARFSLTAILLILAATMPGAVAMWQTRHIGSCPQAEDIVPSEPVSARGLEFRLNGSGYGDFFSRERGVAGTFARSYY